MTLHLRENNYCEAKNCKFNWKKKHKNKFKLMNRPVSVMKGGKIYDLKQSSNFSELIPRINDDSRTYFMTEMSLFLLNHCETLYVHHKSVYGK